LTLSACSLSQFTDVSEQNVASLDTSYIFHADFLVSFFFETGYEGVMTLGSLNWLSANQECIVSQKIQLFITIAVTTLT
jgi:hypothetical protein